MCRSVWVYLNLLVTFFSVGLAVLVAVGHKHLWACACAQNLCGCLGRAGATAPLGARGVPPACWDFGVWCSWDVLVLHKAIARLLPLNQAVVSQLSGARLSRIGSGAFPSFSGASSSELAASWKAETRREILSNSAPSQGARQTTGGCCTRSSESETEPCAGPPPPVTAV